MDEIKKLRVFIIGLIFIYLVFFLFCGGPIKILLGFTILSLLLINNFLEPIKNKQDKAAHETFYDTMKFIVFGIFTIIYPNLKEIPFIVFILGFVLILHAINFIKLKSESKSS